VITSLCLADESDRSVGQDAVAPESTASSSKRSGSWDAEPNTQATVHLESLERWRRALFDRLTLLSFWLSVVVGTTVGVHEFLSGERGASPVALPSVAFFALAAFFRRRNRRLRAVIYLVTIWAACGLTLLGAGYWLAPPFVLVVSVAVVLGLSVGPRMAWIALLGFIAILIALAFHFVGGGLPTGVERFRLSTGANWVQLIIVFMAVSSLSLTSVSFLVGKLKLSEEHNQELFDALKKHSAQKLKAAKREQEMLERLQDSQKLEALGRLAGGVAHDFNNLLTVIIGNANLLRETSNKGEEELDEIVEAGTRASDLAQQLLLFSRNQSMTREFMDFNVALNASMGLLKRLIPSSIQLELKLGPSVGEVFCARTELDQLVMNLCLNARDAMDGTGTLVVTSKRVVQRRPPSSIDAPTPKKEAFVRLEVIDSGAGMSANVQKHLFEPFYTTKPLGEGTGLGLSVVHGIVTSYDGFIEIKSKIGEGTRFRVYLPAEAVTREESLPHSTKLSVEKLRGSETLLLVDDNEGVLGVSRKILEAAGYRVLSCTTGEDALALFKKEQSQIRLLITDAVMPNMGGRELYERIHSLDSKLPVLFCSGYHSGTLPREFFDQPRRALLQKPFSGSQLLRSARLLLDE
jgi:signal transduction histidine kinase